MCVNAHRVDPARPGLRDPHRREPELVRRRADLHRLALDGLRRSVRPDDRLPHGRRLRGALLPVAHAARARPRVGGPAQRNRHRRDRSVVLRRHREAHAATRESPGEEFRVSAAGPAVTALIVVLACAGGHARRRHGTTSWTRCSCATHPGAALARARLAGPGQRRALRLQPDPRLPARRRADRQGDRVEAHRRPQPRHALLRPARSGLLLHPHGAGHRPARPR